MTKRERFTMLNETLDIYLTAVRDAGPGATIVSYSLSSPDGSQSTTRRSMQEMLKAIEDLQNLIDSLENSLNSGTGVHYSSLRMRL
ncbi:hypothetical protein FACS189479_04290 [Spirochaetia bacterium]|nr:hypothetical protein FACS189479_04290 [Spirochaetia bacterium]